VQNKKLMATSRVVSSLHHYCKSSATLPSLLGDIASRLTMPVIVLMFILLANNDRQCGMALTCDLSVFFTYYPA